MQIEWLYLSVEKITSNKMHSFGLHKKGKLEIIAIEALSSRFAFFFGSFF